MGFDKAKVLRAAEKHLAQGKIPAAIAEYRQIVENDANDYMALNVLGDLYVRTDKKAEAVNCFRRIADHYREQGFALKAIAMYKKVERILPDSPDVAVQLAALYEAQGLIVEARAQYMTLAESYSRAGQIHKTLDILRRVADLDPENIDIRRKLAEGYARENYQTEAAASYSIIGNLLLERGEQEKAIGAYTSALKLFPEDRVALKGLLTAQSALGRPLEAALILERAVAEAPNDVELVSMLAEAYVEAEDVSAAERTTTKLVELDKTSYARFARVARLYAKQNEADAAVRVMGSVVQQMLTGREDQEVVDLLREVLEKNPEHINALRLLVHVTRWQRDEERLRAALERLAAAAQAARLVDEERNALAQLARLVPDNHTYFDRLDALGGAPVEGLYESQQNAFEPARTEEFTFESFASRASEEPVVSPATTDTADDASTAGESFEFEWNTVSSEPEAEAPAKPRDPSMSFADLNEDWLETNASGALTNEAAPQHEASDYQEIDFNSVIADAPSRAETIGAEPAAGARDPRAREMLLQELESVDFYLAQGYTDIAGETLNMLEGQFGSHPEINERRALLAQAAQGSADGGAAAATTPGAVSSTFSSTPETTEPEQTVEFSSFTLYDVEEEEAKQEEAVQQPTQVAPPPPRPASTSAPSPAPPPPPAQAARTDESGLDPGLAAVFDEFRAAVEDETPPQSSEDYETHYNLGLAFKEMDLTDEAIEEFQIAAGLATPQDGTSRYLQCCNMIGHCFMNKGMPRLATTWFKKGLAAPGHTEDEYQALRFELGMAYEQMGDLDGAIEAFTEVYGINISYRGVSNKLRELQKARDQRSDVRG